MTCPLSLGAIAILLFVIFYSKDNTVIFVAGGILVMILFNFGKVEKFMGMAENPNDTGVGRPMFGPLFPVTSKVTRENRYRTMHGLPWCESPLGETQDGSIICNERTGFPSSGTPYELDKI